MNLGSFSVPPPPSRFIPQLICPLEVMSSPRCPQQAQGSVSNTDEWHCLCETISVCVCVCVCVCAWWHERTLTLMYMIQLSR